MIILEKTWKPSQCAICTCAGGFVSCRKEITVITAALTHGAFVYLVRCIQPECDLGAFLNNARVCEGEIVGSSRVHAFL